MRNTTKRIIRVTLEADPDMRAEDVAAALEALEGQKAEKKELPLLLNSGDVCRQLKISRQTLWRLSKSGELAPVKVRAGTRYRRSDLENYVDSLSGIDVLPCK